MTVRSAILFLALLACPLLARSAVAGPSAPGTKKAFATLQTATSFAPGAVGYSGTPSSQSEAFRVILGTKGAKGTFVRLYDSKATTQAGRLYALAGLYLLDPPRFEKAAAELAQSEDRVDYQAGCRTMRRPVSDIIDAGDGALRVRPGETLLEAIGRKTGTPDMIGGGLPLELAADQRRAR